MKKYKTGIITLLIMSVILINPSAVFAKTLQSKTEIKTENKADTKAAKDTKDTKTETVGPVFDIKLNVHDGFNEDIEFMLISNDGGYEYYDVLTRENDYHINLEVESNKIYTISYYFKGIEEYEITELQEEYSCKADTLWKLELDLVKRETPLEAGALEPLSDMTKEEYEAQRQNAFKSDLYPGMYEEEIIKSFYNDVKILMGEEHKYEILASGIKNDTVFKYFSGVGGTSEEWENLSEAQSMVLYYGVVMPQIVIKKNSYDYDKYMENLNILSGLCKNINDDSTDKILSSTIKLWDYIWEYYRREKKTPDFETEFITIMRADKISDNNEENKQPVNDTKENEDNAQATAGSLILKFCRSNLSSIIILLISVGTLFILYVKKNGGIKKVLNDTLEKRR